jgi:hypothetical protein
MQVSIYKQLSCLSFLELIFFSFYFGLNFLHCILYHTNKPGSTGLDRYSCICHIKTGNRENAPCRCQKLMPISLFPCTSLRHFVEQNKGENARALQAWAVELHINVGPIKRGTYLVYKECQSASSMGGRTSHKRGTYLVSWICRAYSPDQLHNCRSSDPHPSSMTDPVSMCLWEKGERQQITQSRFVINAMVCLHALVYQYVQTNHMACTTPSVHVAPKTDLVSWNPDIHFSVLIPPLVWNTQHDDGQCPCSKSMSC